MLSLVLVFEVLPYLEELVRTLRRSGGTKRRMTGPS
jgi:hypothetical protein